MSTVLTVDNEVTIEINPKSNTTSTISPMTVCQDENKISFTVAREFRGTIHVKTRPPLVEKSPNKRVRFHIPDGDSKSDRLPVPNSTPNPIVGINPESIPIKRKRRCRKPIVENVESMCYYVIRPPGAPSLPSRIIDAHPKKLLIKSLHRTCEQPYCHNRTRYYCTTCKKCYCSKEGDRLNGRSCFYEHSC
jgi:hypothetical protein